MRYDVFKKARKRHKEAVIAKLEGAKKDRKSISPEQSEDSDTDQDEMRDPIETRYQSRLSRSPKYLPRTRIGIEPVDGGRDVGPSDLSQAVKVKNKHQRKGFLPIAMPRPDSKHEDDDEYDYRSEFEAPDHIELIQSTSYEDARTEVSEITHLTYGVLRQPLSRESGLVFPARPHARLGPHIEHLEDVEEVSEEYAEAARRIKVDVTDLDGIHDAVNLVRPELSPKGPRYALMENRHGLPYEVTDFRAEDDASDDSWGQAIVGSSVPRERVLPSEPIDAEKFLAEREMRQSAPRPQPLSMEQLREDFLPTPKAGSLTQRTFASLKETLSKDGEIIIDLSEIHDDDINAVEVTKTSPTAPNSTLRRELIESKNTLPKIVPGSTRSPRAPKSPESSLQPPHRYSPKEAERTKEESESRKKVAKDPEAKLALGVEIPKASTPAAATNTFLADSMQALKELADGIGSHLGKIDLLPENKMAEMLGVLDKDLKATSDKVPQGKEVVEYLGNQLKNNACVKDSTLTCEPPKQPNLNFTSPSIDEMVVMVKETYQKNILNCGLPALGAQKPAAPIPVPQEFMVPLSLDQSSRHYRSSVPQSR